VPTIASHNPARFMLVAAMNPCRCGRASDSSFFCKRGANERCAAEYQGRLSGPLLDRIDLHVEVPGVTAADLILPAPAEGSREVASRVARARDIQAARYATMGLDSIRTNAVLCCRTLHASIPLACRFFATQRIRCDCPRAAIIGCYESRGHSLISTQPTQSAMYISRRHFPIGHLRTVLAAPHSSRCCPCTTARR
jgi:hypothetical protein